MNKLNHFDEGGSARMVDVGDKAITQRMARARGSLRMAPLTMKRILSADISKGDVLQVARLAGIMGAKQASSLIPLCHPIGLDSVVIDFQTVDEQTLQIDATVKVDARTGVEMEAMTAVSVAALTVYDMCKSMDRSMQIEAIQLLEKKGGKSGHYLRQARARENG